MKTILTDVDGVLLNWEAGFIPWVEKQGLQYQHIPGEYDISKQIGVKSNQAIRLIKAFNHSEASSQLLPYKHSISSIQNLSARGWDFIAITNFSGNQTASASRKRYLNEIYGSGIFKDMISLPITASKRQVLNRYKDSDLYWVEDKTENALLGQSLGLQPILISHSYNQDACLSIPRANDWRCIEAMVS